jgi:hypothetical protein
MLRNTRRTSAPGSLLKENCDACSVGWDKQKRSFALLLVALLSAICLAHHHQWIGALHRRLGAVEAEIARLPEYNTAIQHLTSHHLYSIGEDAAYSCSPQMWGPGAWVGEQQASGSKHPIRDGAEMWGTKFAQQTIYDHQVGHSLVHEERPNVAHVRTVDKCSVSRLLLGTCHLCDVRPFMERYVSGSSPVNLLPIQYVSNFTAPGELCRKKVSFATGTLCRHRQVGD